MTRPLQTANSPRLTKRFLTLSATLVAAACVASAWFAAPRTAQAQTPAPASAAKPDDAFNKALSARLGVPKIDEISRTPFGMLEVRIGNEIYYTDPTGNYLLQGQVFDLARKENMTQARIDKLTAIDWKDLPLQDAIKIVRGNGKRQVAVFEDPNCGYCRVVEQNLQKIDNVTVHVFLLPILSPQSAELSKQIWCSADKGKAWMDWILEKKPVAAKGDCANPIERNLALGQKYKINGTPALFFQEGPRAAGAISPEAIEKRIAALK
jgi:thiol:disulfide interchange protein DsbC